MLQSILRHNRKSLLSHGVHYPEYRGLKLANKMNGNHSLIGKTYEGQQPFWDFANSRVEMGSDCETLLLSGEIFSRPAIMRKILPELMQLSGDCELQFLYYLRRYDQHLESGHAEAVKHVKKDALNTANFAMNFRDVLAPVINAFGAEAVTIRPYVPTQWTGGNLVFDFLDHAGLSKVIPSVASVPDRERINTRLPRSCTFLLEKMPTKEGKRALLQFYAKNPDSLPREKHSFFLSPSERYDLNIQKSEADQGFFDAYGLGDIKTMLEIDKMDSAEEWTPFEPDWDALTAFLIQALSKSASEKR